MLIKNLSFKFNVQNNHYFFKDITIDCTSNAVHFIQGDNGVGKSTLFNILQGDIERDSLLEMSVTLDGTTYTTHNNLLPHEFTKKVQTVQQRYDLMIADQFNFLENLRLANLSQYPTLRSLPQANLFDSIKSLGIDMHTQVRYLSGGQRQLLAIFMALQKPTKLLLLDEPTATLDKKNARLVMHYLHRLARQLKVTMLVICHDKELVKEYAQGHSFVIYQGENGEREIEAL